MCVNVKEYFRFFQHSLKHSHIYSYIKFNHMSKVWKSHHYISYGKTISQRTINNIGNYFIKLSSWKYYSITSFMRLKYKNVSEEDKRKIIQEIYNLMNLSCMCNVFKFVNNKGIVIMNESEITTNIIIYF